MKSISEIKLLIENEPRTALQEIDTLLIKIRESGNQMEEELELMKDLYRGEIRAMDTEVGRVLDHLPPNTIVFFIGDNGTETDATDAPFARRHAKGTLYEGGINVPLIVFGPGVERGECSALVSSTDLFATLAELAGVVSTAEDSVSLVPYLLDAIRGLEEGIGTVADIDNGADELALRAGVDTVAVRKVHVG